MKLKSILAAAAAAGSLAATPAFADSGQSYELSSCTSDGYTVNYNVSTVATPALPEAEVKAILTEMLDLSTNPFTKQQVENYATTPAFLPNAAVRIQEGTERLGLMYPFDLQVDDTRVSGKPVYEQSGCTPRTNVTPAQPGRAGPSV